MTGNRFRCGLAARWLPRALGGAVLAAATLAALRLGLQGDHPLLIYVRNFSALVGALLALWIVRKGAEVRRAIEVGDDGLSFVYRSRRAVLRFEEIVRLGYAAPFAHERNWLPAMLVHDRNRQSWRVPAVVRDGDRLMALFLETTGRSDLETWANTLALSRRMAASGRRVAIGYALAAAVLLAGLLYYYH
jgi:hypothetical protein